MQRWNSQNFKNKSRPYYDDNILSENETYLGINFTAILDRISNYWDSTGQIIKKALLHWGTLAVNKTYTV